MCKGDGSKGEDSSVPSPGDMQKSCLAPRALQTLPVWPGHREGARTEVRAEQKSSAPRVSMF